MRRFGVALAALLALVVSAGAGAADVVRVVVDRRAVVFEGRAFGEAGAYELVVGRMVFTFDPSDPADARVVDLDLAPRNADGLVEVWADVIVLQPVDAQRRRGLAWIDLDDGGVGPAAPLFRAALGGGSVPERGLDDGLLLEEGLTLIRVAWRSGTPGPGGAGTLAVPQAVEADGAPVTGWVRVDWVVEDDTERLPLAREGRTPYPVAVPEAPVHVLTVREGRDAPRDTVPASDWRFVPADDGPSAGRPVAVAVDGGFREGRIYELVYRGEAPRVQGVGLAVVRDVMAYARYDLRSVFPADRGVAFGSGAGGRFLRQFVREGFNADAGGRIVFDAVWFHGAGAGRGSFNARFAQPDRVGARLLDFFYPVDLFPFTVDRQFDPVTGRDEGLLDALPEGATPRTVSTLAGFDYWQRAAALTHTSVDGFRDLVPGGLHRAYHLASTLPGPSEGEGEPGADTRSAMRALALALVVWVDGGDPPPASRLPTVGGGSLVPTRAVAYPAAPGLAEAPPAHVAYRPDYGPRFASEGVVDREPPTLGPAFPAQVPQVDGVGNELGGVRLLDVRVPLATYLPWSVRVEAPFAGEPDPRRGGTTLPFPLTDDEADAAGDARPSLQELYGSEAGFLARVRAAAAALVEEGFLLERDREAAIAAARERWQRITAR